ncbi:50S ribosome-binding GTPase [Candidatus Woesearchaeota archaeon]|nr:50S ribosome-binding GTPase [Candidatus Woesearchaeota archaeon]
MAVSWKLVNNVINDADVLLLVMDSRLVDETRNAQIELKVKGLGKPLIYVINKCDLVGKDVSEKWKRKLKPSVFVSSKDHQGTTMLRDLIIVEGSRAFPGKKPFKVGVLGYPNVGKSSLINAMRGRNVAPASILSGYTRHIKKIKVDNRLMLLDTPGVIPKNDKDHMKHALIGTVDFNHEKDPDLVVIELIQAHPGMIESFYGVAEGQDDADTIRRIAVKRNLLSKGSEPDINRTSRMILKDWQMGKIKEK